MVGGRFNPFGIPDPAFPVSPYSPTLALGAPTLLLLVTVLALRWRGETLPGAWLLVPLLAVVCAGTKGSTAPLVVAGLALAVAAMLVWNRRMVLPALVDLLVVGAGLVFAVIVVFHGSSAGLRLGASNAARQTLLADVLTRLASPQLIGLAVVLAIVGGMSRAALTFVLPFYEDTRKDPLTWVLIGSSFAAACAYGLFSHPGRSQGYFYLTAIPLASLGSTLGVERLLRAHGRSVLALAVGAGVAGGVAAYVVPRMVTGPLRNARTPRSGRWSGSRSRASRPLLSSPPSPPWWSRADAWGGAASWSSCSPRWPARCSPRARRPRWSPSPGRAPSRRRGW